MRIGIDARMWNEGGVGRYIRNLITCLQTLDKDNEYVLFSLSKKSDEILHFVQNDSFRVEKTDVRWHTLKEQIVFPSLLDREKLDLVHFPYPSVPILYNRPFVVTIHDLIPYHFPTGHASTLPFSLYWIKQLGYRLVLSQAIKKAKNIIAVSEATKSEIIDHFGVTSSRIVVTYDGVDKTVQSSIHSTSSGQEFKVQSLKKENPYFLYVGNAYPHKNLERLLEAFRLVCHPEQVFGSKKDSSSANWRTQNDIRIILVVKDDYFSKRLQEKVKSLKADEKVRFFYNVSDSELSSLYRGAKALIAPSLMEGFDLPVVEAMANKCLVIASDIPVHREIAGDEALYFNPDNTQDIVEKLKAVYSHDTYHYSNRVEKGFERAKTFSWKNMAIKTLRAYESCVSV